MLLGKGLDVIKMVVKDSGNLDIGSDHNFICGGGQRLKSQKSKVSKQFRQQS